MTMGIHLTIPSPLIMYDGLIQQRCRFILMIIIKRKMFTIIWLFEEISGGCIGLAGNFQTTRRGAQDERRIVIFMSIGSLMQSSSHHYDNENSINDISTSKINTKNSYIA